MFVLLFHCRAVSSTLICSAPPCSPSFSCSLTNMLTTDCLWTAPPLCAHAESKQDDRRDNGLLDCCWHFHAEKCTCTWVNIVFVNQMNNQLPITKILSLKVVSFDVDIYYVLYFTTFLQKDKYLTLKSQKSCIVVDAVKNRFIRQAWCLCCLYWPG